MTSEVTHALRVLGGIELTDHAGRPVLPVLAQPKRLALLLFLAADNNGGFRRRDTLLGLFWPELEEARARQALNRAVYFLRRFLPPEALVTRGDQEVGIAGGLLHCDAAVFERALAAGELEAALALYRGDLAPGFLVAEAPEFERWLEAERGRLRGLAVGTAQQLATQEEAAGRLEGVERWLRRAAELAPFDEKLACRRMALLHRMGDRASALKVFEGLRRRLREELEVEPSSETVALAMEIRSRQVQPPGNGFGMSADTIGSATAGEPQVSAVRWDIGRRPWRTLAAAATVLLAGGWAALELRSWPPPFSATHEVPLTSEPGVEFQPALSPDGSLVAFTAVRHGRHVLVVRSAAGAPEASELLPARGATAEQFLPTWSPDGRFVRFLDSGAQGLPGPPPVWWEVPALGGAARRVDLPRATRWVAWSRDGGRVAFAVRDSLFLYSTSDHSTVLLSVQHSDMGVHSLAWSPDGRRFAYVAGNMFWPWAWNTAPSAIWVMDVDTHIAVRITDSVRTNVSPAWADSRHLMFISDREGRREVYALVVGPNGPEANPIQVPGGSDAHSISLSADGRRMAVARYITDQNVWSFSDSGTPPASLSAGRPVTAGAQVVETHDVSPDGRWLAFDSNLLGAGSLYRMPIEGGSSVPVVTGQTAVNYPRFSPDGKEIAFSGGPGWDLWVVAADGGVPTRLTSEPGIAEVPIWSPDGLHLVYRGPLGGTMAAWILSRTQVGGPWSQPRRLTDFACDFQSWAPDGSGVICSRPRSDTLTLVSLAGRVLWRRSLASAGLHAPGPGVFSEDGKTLYVRARGPNGLGIWAWPWRAGPPRLVIPLENPALPAIVYPGTINVSRRRVYVTVSRLESDIWVMDLAR